MPKKISLTEILTIIISVIAIVLSFLGYLESKKATDIALKSLQDREKIIWKVSVEEGDYIFESPGDGIILQQVVIRSPKMLGGDVWDITQSKNKYAFTRISLDIERIVKSKIQPKSGYIIMGRGFVPVSVESLFSISGDLKEDISLYMLGYNYIVREDGEVTASPTSAMFSGRADGEAISPEKLDQIMQENILNRLK